MHLIYAAHSQPDERVGSVMPCARTKNRQALEINFANIWADEISCRICSFIRDGPKHQKSSPEFHYCVGTVVSGNVRAVLHCRLDFKTTEMHGV
jgi:hypothetical protein